MCDWPAAPDALPPLADRVHVWAVALDDPRCGFDPCVSRISSDERRRADRFRFVRDRQRYVIAHAALRGVLARYTAGNPADLLFAENRHGKPRLAPPFELCGIEFNLSHSHERALIAVCLRDEVGVDIEYVKTDFDIFEVAQRFFTEQEVAALYALPAALRSQAFHKCWTSKEAFLKARGTGLSGSLDPVEIILHEDRVRIHALVDGWHLRELEGLQNYESALVTRGNRLEVLCYQWQAE